MYGDGNLNLRPLWLAILDIYKEIAKICERHHLHHCVMGGGALGAVRHKGFIPWDDDLDISMLRPEYDRFFSVADDELPSFLQSVTIDNCEEYAYPFGKVIDTRREVVDRVERESGLKLPGGIYVDVFPRDGYEDGMLRQYKWRLISLLVTCVERYEIGGGTGNVSSRLAKMVGLAVSPFFPRFRTGKDIVKFWISAQKRVNVGKCRYVAFNNRYRSQANTDAAERPMKKEFFLNCDYGEFEGMFVPLPGDVHGYLKARYGDYMRLPPIEHRLIPSHSGLEPVPWRFGRK